LLRPRVVVAVDAARLVRIGLWLLAAGNLAWTVTNAVNGLWVNVVTDVVIIAGCATAALSLRNALDGVGLGGWRTGLLIIAFAHFAQNLLNVFVDGLDLPDEWTLFAVMAAAVAVAIGAFLWREDGWDGRAAPWLAVGFAGIAVEPLYYALRYTWTDPWQGGYMPGILLVVAGALLAAWGFLRSRADAA
jgi:hypothetical protein